MSESIRTKDKREADIKTHSLNKPLGFTGVYFESQDNPMKENARFKQPKVLMGLFVFLFTVSAQAGYPTSSIPAVPQIAPLYSKPAGQTYGRWAAVWWQWALGIPAAVNPLLDESGAHCAQRQVDKVWFLAGSFVGPVERTCEIPKGKSLFIPLLNTFYGAFLNDPPEQRTEEYVRSQANCTEPAQISVWINGYKIFFPTLYFTGPSGSQSPIFNLQLPPGNIFGADETVIPELVLSPSAEQGYYLFVEPLPPGDHTIHWVASGCNPGDSQDITYNLTVSNDN